LNSVNKKCISFKFFFPEVPNWNTVPWYLLDAESLVQMSDSKTELIEKLNGRMAWQRRAWQLIAAKLRSWLEERSVQFKMAVC